MRESGPSAVGDFVRTTLGGQCEVCLGWQAGGVCGPCQTRFAALQPRCRSCALPVPEGVPRCGSCLHDPPPHLRCLCAVDYAFPWDRLATRFKFGAAPELAQVLSALMVEAARRQTMDRPELFVPVPLSNQRLAERGYDQAWELARRLGGALQVAARPQVLVRRFDSRQQSQLSRRERQANLRGAFTVPASMKTRVVGRHVGLVDDVMTTGATAHEATAALLAAGARRVDLWVAARTPAPDTRS
jgi:ComF family protein